MGERLQILYMQVRLLRLASERWNSTIDDTAKVFKDKGVFDYIAELWDLFHVEGDTAVLEDINEYIEAKGGVNV